MFSLYGSNTSILYIHSCPISAVPANKQLIGEKRTWAEFHLTISKTQRSVRVYTYRQTDGQTKCILFVTVDYLYIHTSVYLIYPVQEHRKFSQKQDKEEDKKTPIFRSSIKVLLKISKNPSCTQFSSKQAL